MLALSATPGDNLVTVQSVLTNLLISHVEVFAHVGLFAFGLQNFLFYMFRHQTSFLRLML